MNAEAKSFGAPGSAPGSWQGADGERGRSQRSHRLIKDVLFWFFVGDLRLRRIRNLISATRSSGDFAVGQEQFARMQSRPSSRPKDFVTDTVREINFARFSYPQQTSLIVIEAGVVSANYIIAQR